MNVVITGATRGIGRAIAHTFAQGGHTIIACARTVNDLNDMQAAFIAQYPHIRFYNMAADAGEEKSVSCFAKWLLGLPVQVDILINNAGHFAAGAIHNEPGGALQKMMQVNLYGAYHLTRLLLPGMMGRGTGHIFNICSIASVRAFDNAGAYGISKFAMLGFSKNLREEMKPYGVKVTAVCPGATYTSSWQSTGIDPARLMEDNDVAKMVYAASQLSPRSVADDIIMRPQLGDL